MLSRYEAGSGLDTRRFFDVSAIRRFGDPTPRRPTLRRSDASAPDDRRVATLPGDAFLFFLLIILTSCLRLKS